MDFYGYQDTPYTDQIFRYSRNVDPSSGRPRWGEEEGVCVTGAEPSCLLGIDTETGEPFTGTTLSFTGAVPTPNPARVGWPSGAQGRDALEFHSVNQLAFALICSTSIGFSDLDPTACGQSVFNSPNEAASGTVVPESVRLAPPQIFYIPALLSNALVGNFLANGLLSSALAGGVPLPHVSLNIDPCDGFLADCATLGPQPFLLGPQPSLAFTTSPPPNPTMNTALTSQQQALFGCGEFYGTNCELDGIDLANAEASALLQSLVGFEGTPTNSIRLETYVTPFESGGGFKGNTATFPQPGTVGFVPHSGPVCTRFVGGQVVMLPGCRGPGSAGLGIAADAGYDPLVDGTVSIAAGGQRDLVNPFFDPTSPFYLGDPGLGRDAYFFRSEVAAASFNLIMGLVALSTPDDPSNPQITEFDSSQPNRTDGCSFVVPHLCGSVSAFSAITGLQRRDARAAGNGRFGRRDFIWHGGQNIILRYEKRNVLGFSADFAEDVTKTNWGLEATWIEGLPTANADKKDGISTVDTYNLTISVDRPTFINFLNANRTFFFNSQWFFQYIGNYNKAMTGNGPYNILGTFTVQTGYFQDRLLPSVTFVWDMRSDSGAALPQLTYRFTENFSASFGLAAFWGRFQTKREQLVSQGLPGNKVGSQSYQAHVQNGLAVVNERDEIFLRIRYSF